MYINGVAGISAQTEASVFYASPLKYHSNILEAVSPNYKEYIPVMALRRMSKAIKMGLTTAILALKDAGISQPAAIITATGEGCKQDTEKFLEALLEQNEELLSPTSFIQSTHNTVGGQIALHLSCKSYNVTYTQNAASLESALIDVQLQFMEEPGIEAVLVGGVDEISNKITSFSYLDGQLKMKEIVNLELFGQNSPGTITSEGAHFFSISTSKNSAYAQFKDVMVFGANTSGEVEERIHHFLQLNELKLATVDLVILGNNGDSRYDHFYEHVQRELFSTKPQLAYKHLVGDYTTATGYALWLGCKILKGAPIPGSLKLNSMPAKNVRTVLLYNQYLGENHSLILLEAP